MKQYCRYCINLVVGDVAYCTHYRKLVSEKRAKNVTKCRFFDLNPMDAFMENPNDYRPREAIKGQMRIEEFEVKNDACKTAQSTD